MTTTRYRRDVPRTADIDATITHVRAHLAGAIHPQDNPDEYAHLVRIDVRAHDTNPEMLIVLGEIEGEPDAPYLQAGFDPGADHHDITFQPYEEPHRQHHADHSELERFREAQ